MNVGSYKIIEQKIIMQIHNRICETPEEVLASDLFKDILHRAITKLTKRNSYLMEIFDGKVIDDGDMCVLVQVFGFLTKMPVQLVPNVVPGAERFLRNPVLFHEFVEYLYNYWRSYDRFIIADSTGMDLVKRPYRTFHATIGHLTGLIRGMYRDVQENLTGVHPRIYRQVTAGAEVSTIAITRDREWEDPLYAKLNVVPFIRQILLYPPLILNPPMNKRTGRFERIRKNPLEFIDIHGSDWLCYPAKVGPLVIYVYFHHKFSELGHSLCNLFPLAEDEDLERKPDAVFLFGAPTEALDQFGVFPTVFYEDEKNDLLVGAIPGRNEFGYFGYVKKMVLTLHNIIMIKRGRLPFHGALVRVILKGNRDFTILLIGDTGAGKSETLEAFRELGEDHIQDLVVIADDMGSLEIQEDGSVIGYGTETGAFLRLDDLQPGYALGQIDRAIIMSANQVNARIILPVTTYDIVIKGQKIDFIMYANNYEGVDPDYPIIERFPSPEEAIKVFRDGKVMSKGTTTSTGITHSYFANVFGPPQYKAEHDLLADKYFKAFFQAGVFVGQMRTRLGLSGWERQGPREAAQKLLEIFKNDTQGSVS
ncbi:MAG TPA: phosphoenolpyruvate carboxykinase [Candidatus Omnitrophica bacterium]|nr:MAG: hypothetical protein A2Z81_06740 [Omnitrophica WOR_2 bacterium GWA2_45_18]HBR15084.1 phosphoenolpyruvate carboxykinase [Candidatus Omnitrophota bacterium]